MKVIGRPTPRSELFTLPLPRGRFSESTAPWRAALLTMASGVTIGYFSFAIGPTFLSAGASSYGLAVGLVTAALGLLMLWYPGAAAALGLFAVVCGIVAFPVALGGLVVGSVLAISGGALGTAWSRPGDEVVWSVSRAGAGWRAVAAATDLLIATVVVVVLYATVLNHAVKAHLAVWYLLQVLAWLAIVAPGLRTGVTPGRLLFGVRVLEAAGRRPVPARAGLVREAVRALEVVLSVQVVIAVGSAAPWPLTALVLLAVAAAWLAGLRTGRLPHDALAGTRSVAVRARPETGTTAPDAPTPDEAGAETEAAAGGW